MDKRDTSGSTDTKSFGDVIRDRISDDHPVWDTLTNLAAPAAVAISAASYLSGYTHRLLVFRHYGFGSAVTDASIQSIIAQGYLPLVVVMSAIVALTMTFQGANVLMKRHAQKGAEAFPKSAAFFQWARHQLIAASFVQVFSAVLVSGVLGGILSSEVQKAIMHDGFASNCQRKCLMYRVAHGQLYGFMLDQNKDYSITVGRKAATLYQQTSSSALIQ